ILISGGGRCNFTHLHCQPENFLSANPHSAKSALAGYSAAAFTALVEKHRIRYHEKTLGQLFCDRSATEITELRYAESCEGGANILVNQQVSDADKATEVAVRAEAEEFRVPALVVATGGLSIPKMGATSFG